MSEPPTPVSSGSSLIIRNSDGSSYCPIPGFLEPSPSPSDDLNDEYEEHGRLSGNGTADDAFHGTPPFAIKGELADLELTDSTSINRSLSTTTTHLSGTTATEDTSTAFDSFNGFNSSHPRFQLPHVDFTIPDDRITTAHNFAGSSISQRFFFYPQMDPFPVHRIALLAHLKCHLRAAISDPQSRTPVSAVLAEVQYHIALMEPDHGMRLPAKFDRPAIYMHCECMACMVWHPKEVSKMLNLCTFIRGAVVEEVMVVEGVLEEVLATVGDLGWLHAWGAGNGVGRLQDAERTEVSERGRTVALKRVKSAREAAAEMAERLEKQGVLKPTPLVEDLHETMGGRSQANGTRKLTKGRKQKDASEDVEGSTEDRCKVCPALKKIFK